METHLHETALPRGEHLSIQAHPSEHNEDISMRLTFGTVLTVLLIISLQPNMAQDKAKVEKAEDVRKVILDAGFPENTTLDLVIEPFVRFGTQKIATQNDRGDQFDRLEIKKATEPHRNALRKKRLRLDGLKFNVVEREDVDVETKGLLAELDLPMRARGEEPFYSDSKSFSGSLSVMHPSELNANTYAFLTKEKALRACTPAEANLVLQNNGILYHPERATTILLLTFKDKLNVLKDISRNSRNYSVEIEFTELAWERPLAWGYFRRDAYFNADCDCQKLWIDNLLNLKHPQPVYFPVAFGKEEEAKIPEIVRVKLTMLRVIDREGKTVGGYKLPYKIPNELSNEHDESFEYVVEGEKKAGKCRVITVDVGNGEKMDLVRIKAGSFLMGATDDEQDSNANEKPRHRVEISKDFFVGKYVVTQGQYHAVMGKNTSHFKGDDRLPTESISWVEANAFCIALQHKLGAKVDLPSEAQWEYAGRAGTTTLYHVGGKLNKDLANIDGWKTSKVGSYPANAWGLYDIDGNVRQWCSDWFGGYYYEKSPSRDPMGPSSGISRVLRGGSWLYSSRYSRVALRNSDAPLDRDDHSGFRVVFPLE